jgi:GDP-L-fucose synthase
VSITELAALIADVVGFKGKFRYASDKPDGSPRKLLDVSRLSAMGWRPQIPLRAGLAAAYRWYVENAASDAADPDLQTG